MTVKEYNRDYWCVYQDDFYGRIIVSYPILQVLLGSKIYLIMRKLESNKLQKFVVKPFHGVTCIFYRH